MLPRPTAFDGPAIALRPGGFASFRTHYPELCESSAVLPPTLTGGVSVMSSTPCSMSRGSLSQPCLPTSGDGPTQILPFLYLGGQQDAMSADTLKKHNITYVLNLSLNCPRSEALVSDDHFMRIPVNDNYQEKLLPFFDKAFHFLENVRQTGSVALIHCLAGISRSPTLAISYIMRYKRMTSEEAYKFVKSKRSTISPNFNFMGQLLEYERILRDDGLLPPKSDHSPTLEKQDFCPAKVPKSCSTTALFCSLPSSLSKSPESEESQPPNEHGKRSMGPAPERPALLEGASLMNPSRPVALGLKSRKPMNIPSSLAEDLPSPSSELQKLTFDASIANPCFVSPPAMPCRSLFAGTDEGYSSSAAENPIFARSSLPCRMVSSTPAPPPPIPARAFEMPCRASAPFDQISIPEFARAPPMETSKTLPCEPVSCEATTSALNASTSSSAPAPTRSRFRPLNFFSFFRKHEPSGPDKIVRSATAAADLSSFAARPECLAEAGISRQQESSSHATPSSSKQTSSEMTDETDSPESGFQEGYKTSPEQDPERTSIGSTSSHEIAVQ